MELASSAYRLAVTAAASLIIMVAPLAASAQIPREEVLLGAGLRTRPDYDGASTQVIDLIPMIRYFDAPGFVRTTQGILEGGARLNLREGLALGWQLAYEPGRPGFLRENTSLGRDIQHLSPGASLGLHVEWDSRLGPSPINLLVRLRQHLDEDRGAQLDTRFTAGIYAGGPVKLGAFVQQTFATAKALRSFYLTDSDNGGALRTDLGLLGTYDLSSQWVLFGSVHRTRLHGDAASSPITERRSNTYASLSLAYRF